MLFNEILLLLSSHWSQPRHQWEDFTLVLTGASLSSIGLLLYEAGKVVVRLIFSHLLRLLEKRRHNTALVCFRCNTCWLLTKKFSLRLQELYLLLAVVSWNWEKDWFLKTEGTWSNETILVVGLFFDYWCLLPNLIDYSRAGCREIAKHGPKYHILLLLVFFRLRRIILTVSLNSIRTVWEWACVTQVLVVINCWLRIVRARVNLTDNVGLKTCEVFAFFPRQISLLSAFDNSSVLLEQLRVGCEGSWLQLIDIVHVILLLKEQVVWLLFVKKQSLACTIRRLRIQLGLVMVLMHTWIGCLLV